MFIVGKAKQENELWLRLMDFVLGVGWLGRYWPKTSPANTGNGIFRDIRIGDNYKYFEFTFTLATAAAKEGEFTVSRRDIRTNVVTNMPTARVNEVYDQVDGGNNRIIQCYIDFGTIDFIVGDEFKLRFLEKYWDDKIGNNNANTTELGAVEVNKDTKTEVITVTCTKSGGASGNNVVKNLTSNWGTPVEITKYKNISNVDHVKIGATVYSSNDYVISQGDGFDHITILPALDFTGDTTNGSNVISNVVDVSGTLEDAYAGLKISGTGIPVACTILSVDTVNNTITLSQNATLSNTGVAIHVGGTMPDATSFEIQFDAPYVAAKFSVVGDVSGAMAEYTQGTAGTYTPIRFSIPSPGTTTDITAVFHIDDNFLINTQINELKNVNQEWSVQPWGDTGGIQVTWGAQQTQFGQVGGKGLESTDPKWTILKGKGLSGTEEIFVSLLREFSNASQYAIWKLYGMRAYDPYLKISEQTGISKGLDVTGDGKCPIMQFWNSSLPYWIIADGNSIQVIAVSNQAWCHMYLGFYIPYDYPAINPYPLFVGGSGTEATKSVATAAVDNSNFWNHFNASSTSAEWAAICWYGVGSTVRYKSDIDDSDLDGQDFWKSQDCIHPWAWLGTKKLRKGINGDWPILRARLGHNRGELPRVYGTSGLDSQVAGNLFYNSISGKKYIVIRNQNRQTSRNYAAVELS